ncbi:hypothetical protein GSH16_09600 [Rhodobacteraceae bacterium KN286]|uniref:Uncharacterized protein n=1 Tax=Oceanomicrobium pacificus TaxID=2692916 RepID=A0A6B0TX19_9RHOB|nr:hypothetical protein [Oceanomicrobium pacificus]
MICAAVLTAALPALASDGGTADTIWPDCYCTDREGERRELGTVMCMVVDGRSFLARCEMSLNNPMWRDMSEGCLAS